MNRIAPERARRTKRGQGGVMLIEALVAILIFSIGIVALMGLQAVSITQMSQAKYRTDAAYLANQIIGKMWVDPTNLAAYTSTGATPRAAWDGVVASTLPAGAGTIAVNGSSVTVTITWKQPEDVASHQYIAVANINQS